MQSNRRRDLQQLILLFLGAALARVLLGRAINGPSIFTDEYQYVEMARSLPAWKGLSWDGHPISFPCWLYPMLIAPLVNLLSWDKAYGAIRFMNAVLMALTVFPAYALGRELAGHRRALTAAALVALLPAAGYSPTIMSESLFFPVVLLALWTIYRAALTPTPWRRLAAGLVCGVAFHVKPHAMLLPAIAAATVAIFEADRLREPSEIPGRGRLERFLRGVGAHWLTALGWILAILPRVLVVKYIEHSGSPLTMKNFFGSYNYIAQGRRDFTPVELLVSLARFVLAWAWCAGLIPVWVLVRKGIGSLKRRETAPVRLMVILTIVATGAMLWLVARHTLVTNPTWVLHERYFFVMTPMVLILFAALAETDASPIYRRWPWDLVIAAVIYFAFWILKTGPWPLSSSSPTFTGLLLFLRVKAVGQGLIVLFLAPMVVALFMLLFKPVNRFKDQCVIIGLLLVAFNIGWYGFHESFGSRERKPILTLARKIDQKLTDRNDNLLIFKDGLDDLLAWQVGMRNPGVNVTLDGTHRQWWEDELKVGKDGRIVASAAGKRNWLLADNTWKVNRAPARSFDDCSLYLLDGKKPLILDPAQVAAARRGAFTTDTMSQGRAFLNGLKVTYETNQMPPVWVAGRESRIVMKIRNDSGFTFPGGEFRMQMGYHWIDPERTKSWTAVIWDDGRQARFPEWLEPGQSCEITLGVVAPKNPGDRYYLWVSPLVTLTVGKETINLWSIERQTGFTQWINVLPEGTPLPPDKLPPLPASKKKHSRRGTKTANIRAKK